MQSEGTHSMNDLCDFLTYPRAPCICSSLRRGGRVICVGLFGGKLEHPLPMIPLQVTRLPLSFPLLASLASLLLIVFVNLYISLHTFVYLCIFHPQGQSFIGSLTGSLPEARELFSLMKDGKISPSPFHERSISEINEAIADLRAGKYVGRCVFKHDWPEGKV